MFQTLTKIPATILVIHFMGLGAQAQATDPFCQSTQGLEEIRAYVVCQANPRLDGCFNESAEFYRRAGYATVAGAMTGGGMLATRASANYYAQQGAVWDALRNSGRQLSGSVRELAKVVDSNQARSIASSLRRQPNATAYRDVVAYLENPTSKNIRRPLLVLNTKVTPPVYVDLANNPQAINQISRNVLQQAPEINAAHSRTRAVTEAETHMRALEAEESRLKASGKNPRRLQAITTEKIQTRAVIQRGASLERASFTKALEQTFGSTEVLYYNTTQKVSVTSALEGSFGRAIAQEAFVAARLEPLSAEVRRAAARGIARSITPKKALGAAFGIAGVVLLAADAAFISGGTAACAEPVDAYANRDEDCKYVYQVDARVQRVLDGNSAYQRRALLYACGYYKELHNRLIPSFTPQSLTCNRNNNSYTYVVQSEGAQFSYNVAKNGSTGIRSVRATRSNPPGGKTMLFDDYGIPASPGIDPADYRRLKLHLVAANACCSAVAAGKNACLNDFDAQSRRQSRRQNRTSGSPTPRAGSR